MGYGQEVVDGIKSIINSMTNKKQYGGVHVPEDTLLKHVKHCNKGVKKEIENILKKKSEWFIRQKKSGEWNYSLNSSSKKDFSNFLDSNLEDCEKILK